MPQQLAIDVSDAAGQLVNGFSASLEHSRNRLYWSACPGSPGLKRKQRFGTRATTRGRCSSWDPSATASSVTMTHTGTPRRGSCKTHPTRPLCLA